MVSGMACFVTFTTEESELRFKKWIVRGNEKAGAMGLSALGLQAKVSKVDELKYLFMWSHDWLFSLSWFLRFMLWVQFRKIRKTVSLERVNKLALVELVLERGLSQ